MTDLEMTKLCAEAMGLEIIVDAEGQVNISTGYICGGGLYPLYDPLHDDTQAMSLVKLFNLNILAPFPTSPNWAVYQPASQTDEAAEGLDLNHAIVECVAKLVTNEKRLKHTVEEINRRITLEDQAAGRDNAAQRGT